MNSVPAAPCARIFALSCSFRSAEISVLERLSLSRERLSALYAERAFAAFSECVVLSTCNRVEFYVAGEGASAEKIAEVAAQISGVPADEILKNSACFADAFAVRHLFEVASGLDSRMVGEAEILGQTKLAYETACAAGTAGATLNRVFQKSFHAAKWARANTGISSGQISVGNVAVELAARVFGELSRCSVLVIGTGEAGRKTTQAFVSRGAGDVLVASRNFERARAFAALVGAGAVAADSIASLMRHADIVVGCASVSEPLISAETLREILRSRGGRPIFLVDLGMPRNFPSGAESDELWIYGLEDLAEIANENLSAREREAVFCRAELARRADALFEKLA